MIIKEVIISPEFKKDFDNLEAGLQDKVRKILRSIEYNEKIDGVFHIPLRGDLIGFTSVHFNNNSYRLIYRTMKNKYKVLALTIGPRSDDGDIYDKLRRLKDKKKL